MAINNISHGNRALEFIDKRIRDEKYRGARSSQHNRYTMNQIVDILGLLDRYAPNQSLMTIRTTDISKRPQNNPNEFVYAQFCSEAKRKAGIGTQDAMRKNLFVFAAQWNFSDINYSTKIVEFLFRNTPNRFNVNQISMILFF